LGLQRLQGPGAGLDGSGDIVVRVGEGDKARLELGWGEVDPRRQHPPEEAGKKPRIGPRGGIEVHHLVRREEEGEHRPDTVDPDGNPLSLEKIAKSGAEVRGPLIDLRIGQFP
jgi:hypothetical protein